MRARTKYLYASPGSDDLTAADKIFDFDEFSAETTHPSGQNPYMDNFIRYLIAARP